MYGVHLEIHSLETCTGDTTAGAVATFSDNRDGTCAHKEASSHSSFLRDKSDNRLTVENNECVNN